MLYHSFVFDDNKHRPRRIIDFAQSTLADSNLAMHVKKVTIQTVGHINVTDYSLLRPLDLDVSGESNMSDTGLTFGSDVACLWTVFSIISGRTSSVSGATLNTDIGQFLVRAPACQTQPIPGDLCCCHCLTHHAIQASEATSCCYWRFSGWHQQSHPYALSPEYLQIHGPYQ